MRDEGTSTPIVGGAPAGGLIESIVPLQATQRTDVALKTIHRELLRRIAVNEVGVRDVLPGEHLHDFRVAVRRTRTGLRRLPHVYPPPLSQRFAADFAWLSKTTSTARDLEVFVASLDRYCASLAHHTVTELRPLVEFLRDREHAERVLCTSAIESARYAALIDDWEAFLQTPPGLDDDLRDAARPVREVAAERIDKAYRRVVGRGTELDEASPAAAFHQLRLDCKKLRYLLEFFGALFNGEEGANAVVALRATQDSLGAINDLRVQRQWIERFGAPTTAAIDGLRDHVAARQAEERTGFLGRFALFISDDNRGSLRHFLQGRPPT